MISRRRLLGSLAGVGAVGSAAPTDAVSAADATLSVSPTSVAFDEPFDIRVEGAPTDAAVTVAATVPDRSGRQWASFARFTDHGGTVVLADDDPVAGTYESAARMGLVWSMRPVEGDASVYIPPEGTTELAVVARCDGATVGRATVARRFGPPSPETRDPPAEIVGSPLFRPAGEGPFPPVLALHGSGGDPSTGTALLLAAHGYAAFAPRYFGPPDPLPDQLAEVPLEYLDQIREWMVGLPAVRDGPVGLVGTSKGAELALLAGATFDWVGAVAAYAPSAVVWSGLTFDGETVSSWTIDGDPVEFLPTAFPPEVVADYAAAWFTGGDVTLRPTYEVPLTEADADSLSAATIPTEEIDAPVTLVSGGDDALWPSVPLGEIAAERRNERDLPVRHKRYPGAGHAISLPYQPTTGLTAVESFPPGVTQRLGGTPRALARAAADSWPVVRETLAEGLR